ncbi:hypothetical protein Sjap_010820 [Stephania japonica]|uniref:Uncharacterized protein n=1 Tax=Stephania japonica TaxID=461633 RepID=A0AAP0JAA9_9MAGN
MVEKLRYGDIRITEYGISEFSIWVAKELRVWLEEAVHFFAHHLETSKRRMRRSLYTMMIVQIVTNQRGKALRIWRTNSNGVQVVMIPAGADSWTGVYWVGQHDNSTNDRVSVDSKGFGGLRQGQSMIGLTFGCSLLEGQERLNIYYRGGTSPRGDMGRKARVTLEKALGVHAKALPKDHHATTSAPVGSGLSQAPACTQECLGSARHDQAKSRNVPRLRWTKSSMAVLRRLNNYLGHGSEHDQGTSKHHGVILSEKTFLKVNPLISDPVIIGVRASFGNDGDLASVDLSERVSHLE